jgi:hypothetical protein
LNTFDEDGNQPVYFESIQMSFEAVNQGTQFFVASAPAFDAIALSIQLGLEGIASFFLGMTAARPKPWQNAPSPRVESIGKIRRSRPPSSAGILGGRYILVDTRYLIGCLKSGLLTG